MLSRARDHLGWISFAIFEDLKLSFSSFSLVNQVKSADGGGWGGGAAAGGRGVAGGAAGGRRVSVGAAATFFFAAAMLSAALADGTVCRSAGARAAGWSRRGEWR